MRSATGRIGVGFRNRPGRGAACWVWLIAVALLTGPAVAEQPSAALPPDARPVTVDLFVREGSPVCNGAHEFLTELAAQQPGVEIRVYDVVADRDALARLWKLARSSGHEKARLPSFYLCGKLHVGFADRQTAQRQVDESLTVRAFTRLGCPHCRDAKAFLAGLQQRWPAIRVEIYDVINDPAARALMQERVRHYRVQLPSLPGIEVGGRFIVGYHGHESTGREIEDIFREHSAAPRDRQSSVGPRSSLPAIGAALLPVRAAMFQQASVSTGRIAVPCLVGLTGAVIDAGGARERGGRDPPAPSSTDARASVVPPPIAEDAPLPPAEDAPLPPAEDAPLPPAEDAPLPPGEDAPPPRREEALRADDSSHPTADEPGGAAADEGFDVPLVGRVRVGDVGLPTFTFLIGLVDGFNPCAMWVLIFLLSVLVNVRSRRKIALVAGTFVLVSGLAYFAFMAAWLNVFHLLEMQRPVQIALGTLALLIGLVNVKDFFAFHRGLSFSIPEAAKPGIYQRVRRIVTTQYLSVALSGAIVLAVVVNIVELACTAGLPALYTHILTLHELPMWQNYGYLALYNIAYMLDDSLMLAIALVTLSHRKLQEREGRWLKLISGLVILALGLTMLFRPEWLR